MLRRGAVALGSVEILTPQDPKAAPFPLFLLKLPFVLGLQGRNLKGESPPPKVGPRAVYSQRTLRHCEAGGSCTPWF